MHHVTTLLNKLGAPTIVTTRGTLVALAETAKARLPVKKLRSKSTNSRKTITDKLEIAQQNYNVYEFMKRHCICAADNEGKDVELNTKL